MENSSSRFAHAQNDNNSENDKKWIYEAGIGRIKVKTAPKDSLQDDDSDDIKNPQSILRRRRSNEENESDTRETGDTTSTDR